MYSSICKCRFLPRALKGEKILFHNNFHKMSPTMNCMEIRRVPSTNFSNGDVNKGERYWYKKDANVQTFFGYCLTFRRSL